jgi:hypothetical protein
MIFPKKNIYPILVPQQCFIDKNSNQNSYVEMNPSMFISENGKITILVRCVNYIKFYNKGFTMFENCSKSIYYIMNGNIIDNDNLNLDSFVTNKLTYTYSRPIFYTYWKGLEDIRFITSNKLLITVPECNSNGNPSIFCATLCETNIQDFIDCKPNIIEKNWMPYTDINNEEYVIYGLSPFYIKKIFDDNLIKININEKYDNLLKNYHGSTNGIIYNNYCRLFLIHVSNDKTYHRWLLFNIKNQEIHLSKEFIFFNYSYIEFTCSLCEFNKRIFVSLGVNDNKAFIIEINLNDILKEFDISFND